jgi:protein gp37
MALDVRPGIRVARRTSDFGPRKWDRARLALRVPAAGDGLCGGSAQEGEDCAMSKIEWTEKTWNPIVGCSLVSPGCAHCYAMKMAHRLELMGMERHALLTKVVKGKAVWTGEMRMAPEETLLKPLRRKKPTMWFVNSMSDLFHESVPEAWIDRVFEVMDGCVLRRSTWDGERWHPHRRHTFQILTKRSERMRDYMRRRYAKREEYADKFKACPTPEMRDSPGARQARQVCDPAWDSHIWLGVSAEDQKRADERIPDLLATPAAVRFVSAEPLLGPIDFTRLDDDGDALNSLCDKPGLHVHFAPRARTRIDWVIVGGESGPDARPMHPDWARSIRDQCQAAGVPFFFKQWGHWHHGSAPSRKRAATRHVVFKDGTSCIWTREACEVEARRSGDWAARRPEVMTPTGKSVAGRLLDGREWNEMPNGGGK